MADLNSAATLPPVVPRRRRPLDYHDAAAATKTIGEQRDFYRGLIANTQGK
jgi:hypothetical protein